jgi:Family of unknown function (DUF6476)
MRALKVLVVVMGVMLVGGVVTLVAVILTRFAAKPAPAPSVAAAAPPGAFGHAVVEIPAGAVIAGTVAVGNRLVLQLALEDGGQRLLVLDPGSGALLGTIELRPEK